MSSGLLSGCHASSSHGCENRVHHGRVESDRHELPLVTGCFFTHGGLVGDEVGVRVDKSPSRSAEIVVIISVIRLCEPVSGIFELMQLDG